MNASKWLEEAALNMFFRNTPVTSPANIYLALYKTNPTDFDNGLEVSGGGYARQQIIFGTPTQSGGIGQITNTNSIAFPVATADWTASNETIGFWGIRTAATIGNLLAWGEFLDTSKANNGKYQVTTNDQYNVKNGAITVTLNNKVSTYFQGAMFGHFFRNAAITPPAKVYAALYTTDPTSADVGVEVTYPEYARQALTFAAPSKVADASQIAGSVNIDFPIPSVDVGSIAYFGIRDGATGGNLLISAAFPIAKTILAGMQISITAGNMTVSAA